MFNFFKKKEPKEPLTLESLVEMNLITREEMLLLKKERATREWENEAGLPAPAERSHHKKRT